jgi:hypothetical protein
MMCGGKRREGKHSGRMSSIQREREREREREIERERERARDIHTHTHTHIHLMRENQRLIK